MLKSLAAGIITSVCFFSLCLCVSVASFYDLG